MRILTFLAGCSLASLASLAIVACSSGETSSDPGADASTTTGTDGGTTSKADGATSTPTPDTFAVGGTISGLKGAGLVLQNNAGDDLPVDANGAFKFKTKVDAGTKFAVTVKTQPSGPAQTCTVNGGTGTVGSGDVTSVAISCADDKFTVGGTVSGLAGTVVLQNNGGDDLTLSNNGTFAFATPLDTGADYAVTVKTQPGAPSQTCTLASATGKVGTAKVTSVALTCVTNTFKVKGTVTGLTGAGLVLTNKGADDLPVAAASNAFEFATAVPSGQTYTVAVKTAPSMPTQTCAIANGSGTVGAADVTNVALTCTTNAYDVVVTVAGLTGTVVLQNNGGDDRSINANGPTAFAGKVLSGANYAVTVKTHPAGQFCTVTNGSGTITNANAAVTLTCANTVTYGPTHTFEGLTSYHYITQGLCSLQQGQQADANYFCQRFYKNNACTATSFTPGNTPFATYPKMHKNGGCTSNGSDVAGTTCQGGPCKIGNWSESTSGLNDIVCVCPAP